MSSALKKLAGDNFAGLLTRNEWGEWFHCGEPVKFCMCTSCDDEAGCFVSYCWDWDCGWGVPDCEDLEYDPIDL